MTRTNLGCLVLAGLLLLGGCGTYRAYPGPRLPAAEIATLEVPRNDLVIDGTAIDKGGISRVELLPGTHRVEWTFTYPNGHRESCELTFIARAGDLCRLGSTFFPSPHPLGFIGAALDLAAHTAILPIELLFPPPEPAEPPEGELYTWVILLPSRQILAGLPPDLPVAYAPINVVPVEEDEDDWLIAGEMD